MRHLRLMLLCCLILCSAGSVFAKYEAVKLTKPDTLRASFSLDGTWKYIPVQADEFTFPGRSAKWLTVEIPEEVYNNFKDHHRRWYKKEFHLPKDFSGSRIKLRFDAVKFECTVYVNRQKIGTHVEGWSPFELDATDAVKFDGNNEILVAVTDISTMFTEQGTVLTPVGMEYENFGGIWQPVHVKVYPHDIYVDDIFIIPSVRDKQLTLNITVKNETSSEKTVTLANIVEEGISFDKTEVTVPPKATKTITVAQQWDDPVLWWPDTPHLYFLNTDITADNILIDRKRTRFGFREVWLDNHNVILNGEIVKLRCFSEMMGWHPQLTKKEQIINYYGKLKNGRVDRCCGEINNVRFHVWGAPEIYLDAADEAGMLITMESSLWCKKYAFDDDRFWNNFNEQWRGLILRDRNHPSLISYSLENEVLVCSTHKEYPSVIDRFIESGSMVKELDPTRHIMFNGDTAMNETCETINIHYPRQLADDKWLFPNSIYWLNDPMPQEVSNYRGDIYWVKKRPLIIGEWAYSGTCVPPDGVTRFMGEDAYIDRESWIKGWNTGAEMLYKGFRYCDVAGQDPWFIPGIYMRAEEIMIKEYNKTFYAGDDVTRTMFLFNDTLKTKEYEFTWMITDDKKNILGKDTKNVTLTSGIMQEETVSLTMPVFDKRTDLTFTAMLKQDDTVSAEISTIYSVFPRTPLSVPSDIRILLHDPDKTIKKAFKKAGIAFTPLTKRTDITQYDVFIIGRDGDDKKLQAAAPDISTFVNNGGRLICLQQDHVPAWLPVKMKQRGLQGTITFPAYPEHPVLEDVAPDDLKYWGKDYITFENTYLKPSKGNFRIIVDAGTKEGMTITPLFEIFTGKGMYIISQMLLEDKLGKEPAADLILQNILNYSCGCQKRRIVQTGILVPDRTQEVLDSIGLIYDDLSRISPVNLEKYGLLIIDAHYAVPDMKQLKTFLADGGTIFLHRLTPAALRRYKQIFPGTIALKKQENIGQVLRTSHNDIVKGINQYDLYWRIGSFGFHLTDDWRRNIADIIDYAIDEDLSSAHTLTKPGAIAVIPSGKGRIIVDQLLWDNAWKTFAKDRAERIIAMLLTNQGAVLDTGLQSTVQTAGERRITGDWSVQKIKEDMPQGTRIWAVLGPFENPEGEDGGFSRKYINETGELNLGAKYTSKVTAEQITWTYVFGGNQVDLNSMLYPNEQVIAYAYTHVYSPVTQKCRISVGSDDGCKVWVNETEVISHFIQRAMKPGQDIADVTLNKGWNKILIKVEERVGGWEFVIDFIDANDKVIEGLIYNTDTKLN